jgi:glycerophosphoryl diester phosphodiesterase
MLMKSAVVSFVQKNVAGVTRVEPQIPSGHITMNNPLPLPNTQLLGPFWPLLYVNPLYVRISHWLGSIVAPLDPAPEPRIGYYLRLAVDAVLADHPASVLHAMAERGSR